MYFTYDYSPHPNKFKMSITKTLAYKTALKQLHDEIESDQVHKLLMGRKQIIYTVVEAFMAQVNEYEDEDLFILAADVDNIVTDIFGPDFP